MTVLFIIQTANIYGTVHKGKRVWENTFNYKCKAYLYTACRISFEKTPYLYIYTCVICSASSLLYLAPNAEFINQ